MHLAAEGGSLDVIKYLLPVFRARVHERDPFSYTMLHWAAQMGHCQVARYLIAEVKLDPLDRDKVCGVPGDCAGFKVQVPSEFYLLYSLVCVVKLVVTKQVSR